MSSNKKIEDTKMSLKKIETLVEIKENPVVRATITSIIKSIPAIGTFIDNSIDVVINDFQAEKREELLNIILSDQECITSDMVNDVEFIMNFGKVLESVNRLATNDKIQYFANLIRNGYFTEDKIKNDEFEQYLDIINRLSYSEINLLFLFASYRISKKELKDKMVSEKEFLNLCKETLGIDSDMVIPMLYKLQTTGFVIPFSQPSGMMFLAEDQLKFLLTARFDNFSKRISGNISK